MANISLEYTVPSADVADYVTLFYHFRADVPVFEDTERAGHAQLRFRLSPGGAVYSFPDGRTQDVADIHIIGPTSGAMGVVAQGPVRVFGMGITAAGWAAIVRTDASAMLDQVIDVAELLGQPVVDAAEALRAAPDNAAETALGEALVRRLVAGADGRSVQFMQQVDAWLAGHTSPDINALIDVTGLSRRQVERRCNQLYGSPPKLLARKYRALRAAVALVAETSDLDAAIDRGFYDQSHMIREIKQFTGFTPCQMRDDPTALARLTIAQRHALGGRVRAITSET